MYIVFSVLAIGLMILVHELGHFLTARAVKMPVHELAIGFGPKLLSRERNGITYSLRAVPFGGFVSFGDTQDEDALKKYYETPVWKRTIVTFAGSAVNILVALLLCFGLLLSSGYTRLNNGIAMVSPNSPAEEAGIRAGDLVVAVDDQNVAESPEQISTLIGNKKGAAFSMDLKRGEETFTVALTPKMDAAEGRYLIGITLDTVVEPVPVGLAFKSALQVVGDTIVSIVDVLKNLFSTGEGAGDMMGVVGVVSEMSTYGQTYGFATFLSVTVMIMVNLGFMNLLPIPGLDGSKLIFLAIEAVCRKPVSVKVESIVNMIGFGLLFIVFILITYKDITGLIFGG